MTKTSSSTSLQNLLIIVPTERSKKFGYYKRVMEYIYSKDNTIKDKVTLIKHVVIKDGLSYAFENLEGIDLDKTSDAKILKLALVE